MRTFDEFQREKKSLQKDLNSIHTQVIERQIESARRKRLHDNGYKF